MSVLRALHALAVGTAVGVVLYVALASLWASAHPAPPWVAS